MASFLYNTVRGTVAVALVLGTFAAVGLATDSIALTLLVTVAMASGLVQLLEQTD